MSESNSIPDGFRAIPGYQRYAIDEHGNVLSICGRGAGWRKTISWADARRMSFTNDNSGYHRVSLNHDGHTRQIPVHTLVLLSFVGPRPDGMQCRHLDGNQCNNHVSNLAWGTPLENSCDKVLHGTTGQGENNPRVKLKPSDVLEIRRRAANGERLPDIAKDFPVARTGIFKIVRRETWKHI